MASGRVVLFLFAAATLQVYANSLTCNVPSRFWCESEEIATACGVYDQCKKTQWTQTPDAKLVDVALYYESLCPYSKNFITTKLYPTFKTISSIMNLTLVPYGNAQETQVGSHWNFQCQHGPNECVGNVLSSCAIAIVKEATVYFPFLNCLESSSLMPRQAADKCAVKFPVPLNDILNCTSSDYGNQLEHAMALQTAALVPKHEFVPWVTLNGAHTDAIQNEADSNLLQLVCDTYRGTKPTGCST